MSKIGISIKLDVKKLDKARFFAAQSGALYVDLTMFLDPNNEGQYGDHGFITQSTTKEERDANVQMPILGNGKIFYGLQELKGGNSSQQQGGYQNQTNQTSQQTTPAPGFQQPGMTVGGNNQFDDDVPFAPIGLQHKALLNCI